EALLAPDSFAELWLDVLDVLADLGGNACDDHRRQRGVLDEGDVRSVSCSSGGDEFVGRVVTAAGIGMADLDVGMRRVPCLHHRLLRGVPGPVLDADGPVADRK